MRVRVDSGESEASGLGSKEDLVRPRRYSDMALIEDCLCLVLRPCFHFILVLYMLDYDTINK